jgi:hypothetical protein
MIPQKNSFYFVYEQDVIRFNYIESVSRFSDEEDWRKKYKIKMYLLAVLQLSNRPYTDVYGELLDGSSGDLNTAEEGELAGWGWAKLGVKHRKMMIRSIFGDLRDF